MSNQAKTASDHDGLLVITLGVMILGLGLFAKYVLAG